MPYFHIQPYLIPEWLGSWWLLWNVSLFPFPFGSVLTMFSKISILPECQQPCDLGRRYIQSILRKNRCSLQRMWLAPQKTGLEFESVLIPRAPAPGPMLFSHLFPLGFLICKTMWIPVPAFLTNGKRRKFRSHCAEEDLLHFFRLPYYT